MDWTTIGGIAGVAAVAIAVLAWRRPRPTPPAPSEPPNVIVKAFIERRRQHVRVQMKKSGEGIVVVSRLKIGKAIGGSRYREPEVVPTVRIEDSQPVGRIVLKGTTGKVLTLRRTDGSKFEDWRSLRTLVDIAGEQTHRVVPLEMLDETFT